MTGVYVRMVQVPGLTARAYPVSPGVCLSDRRPRRGKLGRYGIFHGCVGDRLKDSEESHTEMSRSGLKG